MGQGSSQPGSPQLSQESEVDGSRSRKGKKSKSKKVAQDEKIADTVTQRAALEEESARALVQLSSSALHHDTRAPYYTREEHPQLSAPVAERAQPEAVEVKRPLKKKKKKKPTDARRKKKSKTEDGTSWTRPAQDFSLSPSTHPLDREASDNELVQEYEVGLSRDQVAPGDNTPQQHLINLDYQGEENAYQHSHNSGTSSHERTKTRQKSSLQKRKRHTPQTVDDVRGKEIPLDPKLHSIGAFLPSINPDTSNESGVNLLSESHSRNEFKRRRVEEPRHIIAEGDRDGNAYDQDGNQTDPHDQIIRGFEDENNQLSSGLGDPYVAHTDVAGLQRQARATKEKNGRSDKSTSSGKYGFNADEITKLDNLRDRYCAANDMPLPAFNHFIQSNLRANEQVAIIFNAIQDLFPDRSRSSVQRFCRRRFHNFHARGVWAPEEDMNLKAAVASKGTCWKIIGEELGRFSEDCRDRYRNYLAPSAEHRNRDAWTETEVINLSHSILECMQRMKHERQRKNGVNAGHPVPISDSDSDQEADDLKLINWQTVSDLMGSYGTARSRIQCSFKWSKIKEADRGRYLKEIKEAKANLRNLESGNYTANNMKNSTGWRLKAASKQVKNMKSGDKYDLLNAILGSAAPREENIPWRVMGDDAFRRRWSFSERKAGWLMMKEQVEGSEHMDYRHIIHQLLADLRSHGVAERWNIDVHGLVDGSPVKRPRQTKNKTGIVSNGGNELQARPGEDEFPRGGAKSDDYVRDSDEDEETVEAAPVTAGVDSRHDRGSESPNSLFDDERSPTYQATLDQPVHDPNIEHEDPVSAEISPDLANQIQSYLLQAT